MAVLPIRLANDPVLRQKAKKVRTIDDSIQKLIDDMIETVRDAPGVGLAANQVGVALRVIVIEVPNETDDNDEGEGRAAARPEDWMLYTIVNPQIVKRSGQRTLDEGCLSIPGYKAPTPRSATVTVKGLDRDGTQIRIKAKDSLLAEALEHEIDHLNGVLYVDHLESPDLLVRLEEEPACDAASERAAATNAQAAREEAS